MKHIAAVIVVTAVLLFTQTYTSARGAEYKIPQTVDMTPVAEEPAELYALSAVLMDGESGRVLYEKDGERPLANASTTKVLTCIVALENSPGDDYVQVSQNAASQPEVKLGLQKGEQYYLEDLLPGDTELDHFKKVHILNTYDTITWLYENSKFDFTCTSEEPVKINRE